MADPSKLYAGATAVYGEAFMETNCVKAQAHRTQPKYAAPAMRKPLNGKVVPSVPPGACQASFTLGRSK